MSRYAKGTSITVSAGSSAQETILTGLENEKRTVQTLLCDANSDFELSIYRRNELIVDAVKMDIVNDVHGIEDLGIELAPGDDLTVKIEDTGSTGGTVDVIILYDVE